MAQDLLETKRKILSIIRLRGPSLPVHIAKQTGLNSLLASALLSELSNENEIKISNLKVGSSPLYFMQGQEFKLENFSSYLPQKEKEAFLLIKQKKLLEDRKQEPAIRVALRNLKDFVFPLIIDRGQGQELFLRFYNIPEQEAREKITEKIKTKIEQKQTALVKKLEQKQVEKKEKPLLEIAKKLETKIEAKKPKEKPDFAKKIASLLTSGDIEMLEEKEAKKREFELIVRINSQLGKMKFLCLAKDKKRITENDLTLALQKSQTEKLPILYLSTGELNKKATSYLQKHSGLIIFKKIKEQVL